MPKRTAVEYTESITEFLAALRDERIIEWGWDMRATLLRSNPNTHRIDQIFPDYESLTGEQQVFLDDLYNIKNFRDTPMYDTESFRKAFEAMVYRALSDIGSIAHKKEGQ